jgi:hypothetical protein
MLKKIGALILCFFMFACTGTKPPIDKVYSLETDDMVLRRDMFDKFHDYQTKVTTFNERERKNFTQVVNNMAFDFGLSESEIKEMQLLPLEQRWPWILKNSIDAKK